MKASFFAVAAAGLVSCLALTACTVHQTEAPPPAGPSDLGLSGRMEANPDSIGQDGGSQSSVRVFAFGPDGRPLAGVTFRIDMGVQTAQGLVMQDFGALSARSIVTGSDGTARVIYTAPAADPAGLTGTCNGLPGNCVTIVATPTSTNFGIVSPQTVTIRLVPLGVILPTAGTPLASFTFTPSAPVANSPTAFDASASCGSTSATGACTTTNVITSYDWTFGDGSTATGKVVSHTFTVAQTYNVTLTVTNDRGISASTTRQVTVGAGAIPASAQFRFSPSTPQVNQLIFFDASESRPGLGHTLVRYSWQFGDGSTGSGITASHAYTSAGVFNVTLTVVDDAGQTLTANQPVTVGAGTGTPFATFTGDPPSPVVAGTTVKFDASGSTAAAGARIVTYQWTITGDPNTYQLTTPIFNYSFPAPAGDKTVLLTVFDNQGRSGTASKIYTVR